MLTYAGVCSQARGGGASEQVGAFARRRRRCLHCVFLRSLLRSLHSYSGAIKALYYGAIQALLRRYEGAMKAL